MLTADEARKIAIDEDKAISKQFEEIEKYISEAAFNGSFSVHVAGVLHPYVEKYLKNIGYRVATNISSSSVFSSYSISWVK
jgi:hypothetical protein